MSVGDGTVTPMSSTDAITLALGAIGTATGVAALWWQIAVQRKSGRLVTVTATYSMPVYGPPDAPEFHDYDQVTITVTNRGGAPVSVLNFGVSLDGKKKTKRNLFVTRPVPWSSRLPAQVAPGGEPALLNVPVAELRKVHAERGIPFKQMRPWVDLGDGRRVFADRSVPLK